MPLTKDEKTREQVISRYSFAYVNVELKETLKNGKVCFYINITELAKFTLIPDLILLFFKEGGSEGNPLFQKSVVSSEGLLNSRSVPQFKSFGMAGARQQGGRGETFFKKVFSGSWACGYNLHDHSDKYIP